MLLDAPCRSGRASPMKRMESRSAVVAASRLLPTGNCRAIAKIGERMFKLENWLYDLLVST